jgi:hypothetical protein
MNETWTIYIFGDDGVPSAWRKGKYAAEYGIWSRIIDKSNSGLDEAFRTCMIQHGGSGYKSFMGLD